MSVAVSVKYVVYQQYQKADGTYPIRIRITFKRKSKVISTNLTARPDQLTRHLEIKDRRLRQSVECFVDKIQDAVNKIDTTSLLSYTIDDVVKNTTFLLEGGDESFSLDFIEYANKIADEKPKNSRTNYMCAIHSFCDYIGTDEFDISVITSSLMRGYESYLKSKYGDSARAVSLYTAAIAYIHKRAQLEYNNLEIGEIRINNPFSYYKPPKQKQGQHRNVDLSLIQKMIDMRCSLIGRERLGVDVFLISFSLMGMNTPDIYQCLPAVNGVIEYERTKTRERRSDNAKMRVKIDRRVEKLFAEYADEDGTHQFNFYKKYGNYKNLGRAANIGLSEFCDRLCHNGEITVYSARHSFATIGYASKIDKSIINDCLCHIDPGMRVTDIYVEKDWSVLWRASEKILSRLNWNL